MLKLVDRCDNLLFLGVENSANMWRKRKQAQYTQRMLKHFKLPKISICFLNFSWQGLPGLWFGPFWFSTLLGIFSFVPYMGIGEMIQFDVSFSDELNFFQQPDYSFWWASFPIQMGDHLLWNFSGHEGCQPCNLVKAGVGHQKSVGKSQCHETFPNRGLRDSWWWILSPKAGKPFLGEDGMAFDFHDNHLEFNIAPENSFLPKKESSLPIILFRGELWNFESVSGNLSSHNTWVCWFELMSLFCLSFPLIPCSCQLQSWLDVQKFDRGKYDTNTYFDGDLPTCYIFPENSCSIL